ncbi:MAG: Na/Pi cotransporter family protein [Oscillospiraceae bacterium]|nr:Na/Pi cotransporter family protein [Oscillospiraceae bacterium]
MSIFDIISLFGGLAMFLYGMRLMGDSLKESSSGTLKMVMEKVTNNPFRAFILGLLVTGLIQSSTATIVITSGLVGAGIITLRQSLGIIVGANVGTTVTGQIIRLLDIRSGASGILRVFSPSTLAPVALVIGIVILMFGNNIKNSRTVSGIALGFGILFSGLLNMTAAVDSLAETGIFENLFSMLGRNPILGYAIGVAVSFVLQSSSAAIGILQAFSASGQLMFNSIYAVIVGIYLGDCVTTFIVAAIGAKADAKRVGMFHIIFNLSKTVLVLGGVAILRATGVLDNLWNATVTPGIIADTHTIFNLVCSLLLFPLFRTFENLSRLIIKDDPVPENKYADKLASLSPTFLSTPAIALNSIYDVLLTMLTIARTNINSSIRILRGYDPGAVRELNREEESIDLMADHVSRYLVELSPHLTNPDHIRIINQYYKMLTEFEHLGDYAVDISEVSRTLQIKESTFSDMAYEELDVIKQLLDSILDKTETAFESRNLESATALEPMIEVGEELIAILKEKHLARLTRGECSGLISSDFMNLLVELQGIMDTCSNIGLAIILRIRPELADIKHDYLMELHTGKNSEFNTVYTETFDTYFEMLRSVDDEDVVETAPQQAADPDPAPVTT